MPLTPIRVLTAVLAFTSLFSLASAHAAPTTPATKEVTLTLDFKTLNLAMSTSLGKIANSSAISTYATNKLIDATGDQTVKLTVSGALATRNYGGEADSTGKDRIPVASTLGADGNPFLINDNFGLTGGKSDQIQFAFKNFSVTGVQFEYEIFPDVTCSRLHDACKHPDFSFSSTGPRGTTDWFTSYADDTVNGYLHLLAQSPTELTRDASFLNFKDWPAEIGIADIVIHGCTHEAGGTCATMTTTVPEPGTLAMLGLGLFGFAVARRKATKNQA